MHDQNAHTTRTFGEITREAHDFGVKDPRGRAIGASVSYAMITHEKVSIYDVNGAYWRVAPGAYFGLHTQATRDGRTYGASQTWQLFKTAGDRSDALGAYLRGAEKRARKLAGVS